MSGFLDWWGGSSNSSTQTKLNKIEKEIDIIKTNVSSKVDKVNGKGLSTNDFTDEYKNKVDNFTGDTVNVVENNVEVDATLSKEGYAADAKATGKKIEEMKKSVSQSESSIMKNVKEYINSLTLGTEETSVVTPVADTTDYVTPQMFGAKGDGWTDDTEAIKKAIDSGKSVYFPHGEYVISESITIDNKKFWNLYAQDAIIRYTGNDYAFRVLNVIHCCIALGYIQSANGGGVEFYSDSIDSWNQYVILIFNTIGAKTDCIHVETTGEGWSNENQVYGGRFLSGDNGVNVVSRSTHTVNGWKFYNCGIEGVDNGFLFDATEEEDGAICNMVISNCRYGESFNTILKTVGLVVDCLWIAPTRVLSNFINASKQTTRFEIIAPIGEWWRLGYNLAWHRGCIIDGKLMGEKTEYIEVE